MISNTCSTIFWWRFTFWRVVFKNWSCAHLFLQRGWFNAESSKADWCHEDLYCHQLVVCLRESVKLENQYLPKVKHDTVMSCHFGSVWQNCFTKMGLKRQETCDIIWRDFGLVTVVNSCHNTVNARKYPSLLPQIKANHSCSIVIDFLFNFYSCPIHFLFISYSFHVQSFSQNVIRKWNEVNGQESKSSQWSNP